MAPQVIAGFVDLFKRSPTASVDRGHQLANSCTNSETPVGLMAAKIVHLPGMTCDVREQATEIVH